MSASLEVTVAEILDRRLASNDGTPIVIAFSGGGDSLALLHLVKQWWPSRDRRLVALTLDHGLSIDSFRRTNLAGALAREVRIKWARIPWEGEKPSTGIQAKARAARHTLLANAARAAGARVIVMGHTADDVAESELMRATDTPGLGRMREWSPSPVWPEGRGVFLLRPLLAVSRAELRDYLAAKDAIWLEDPANGDRRYARIRARERLSALDASAGVTEGAPTLSRESEPLQRSALTPNPGPSPFEGERSSAGVAFEDGAAVASLPLSASTLAALLLCVSGITTPPRGAALARLRGVIAAGGVATLCGCRIETRGETIRVTRAPPRRGAPLRPLEPAEWMRYRFDAACGLYPDEASIPSVA